MLIPEPLGVVGAPLETLAAIKAHFEQADLSGATLILVTDSQGQRNRQRYAVLIQLPHVKVVTVEAFGPYFGPEGAQALRDLAAWAHDHGIERVKETVVNTYDFNRVMREPEAHEIERLIAAANPSDLNIYLQ